MLEFLVDRFFFSYYTGWIYVVEMALKVYSYGFANYWRDGQNRFDFVITGIIGNNFKKLHSSKLNPYLVFHLMCNLYFSSLDFGCIVLL